MKYISKTIIFVLYTNLLSYEKNYLVHGEKNFIILNNNNNNNSPYLSSDFLQNLNKNCLKQEISCLKGKPEEL